MGNTDNKESKKFKRKIRIRLTDPDIPDSYICEIFDSSLENEDDELSKNNKILQEGNDDPPKPKNYFDLLMSKNCKKNGVIKAVKENNKSRIAQGTDDDDGDGDGDEDSNDDDDEAFEKGKWNTTTTSRNSLGNLVNSKNSKIICKVKLSRKKRALQNQREIKAEDTVVNQESEFKEDLKEDEMQSEDLITIFDPPKIDMSQKKTLNILNYFSKREISSNSHLKHDKSAEFKTNQSLNNLKHSVKNDFKNSSKNSANQILLNGINKENLKLAPLFTGKKEKILDSVRQKARLEFLFKGSQSAFKKSETKTKTNESILYFPVVTHVQQRNENLCWSLRHICLPLQKVCSSESVFKGGKKFSLEIQQSTVVNKAVSEDRINLNRDLLGKIKNKYLELNLESVIDGLKNNRDRFSAQLKEIAKKKSISPETYNDNLGYEELNGLWTEKYKPKSSEILGNSNVVRKLKNWLQSWKSFNNELKVLVSSNQKTKCKQTDSDDDENDFLDFTNENYGLKMPGNVCIISGPNGCGKSALVYALANELEFNVLELNASSKRTGKKVLSDLQEATQSHKVHRVAQNIAVQQATKKKKVKKQKKNKKEELLKITDQTKDWKMSLILIEDADIVFDDHDEGFYSAMASLVQTSKRPLIFLTNEPNYLHLENLKATQCLKLEMEPPNFYKSCAVLDVVSSLEGFHFEEDILGSVLRQNGFDLRKSLLELQFWIGSSRNFQDFQRVFDLGHLWWGLSKFLFNKDKMHLVKCKARKRKRAKDLFDSSDDEVESAAKKFKSDPEDSKVTYSGKADAFTNVADSSIESYFRVLDIASTLDGLCLTRSQEPIPGNECRPKDSLALCENMEEVFWGRRLTEELSFEMINLSAKIFSKSFNEEKSGDRKLNLVSPCWEEVRWRSSQKKASEELSELVCLQKRGEKRSLYLDYLPVLRNICRVERHRSEINPKRKNRFYHYLNNMGPELTNENLEINCKVFNR